MRTHVIAGGKLRRGATNISVFSTGPAKFRELHLIEEVVCAGCVLQKPFLLLYSLLLVLLPVRVMDDPHPRRHPAQDKARRARPAARPPSCPSSVGQNYCSGCPLSWFC